MRSSRDSSLSRDARPDEPASPEAIELNYLLLEQRRIEAEIAAAAEPRPAPRRAEHERAALVQRIAHAERVGG